MPRLDLDALVVGREGLRGFRVKIVECSEEFYEKHLRDLGFIFSDGASLLETTDRSAYQRAREVIVTLGLDSVRARAKREDVRRLTRVDRGEPSQIFEFPFGHPPSETDLKKFLTKNIGLLEKGLSLVRDEYPLKSGRADIMAVDMNENYVLVELKIREAKADSLVQLLNYMHSALKDLSSIPVLQNITKRRGVRGIIVAPSFDKRLQNVVNDMAKKRIGGMRAQRYKIKLVRYVLR